MAGIHSQECPAIITIAEKPIGMDPCDKHRDDDRRGGKRGDNALFPCGAFLARIKSTPPR
jgi:hypothetical protein